LIVIIPTKKCNLRCKHCLRDNYSEGDLQLETLRKFIIGAYEHNLEREFSLTGGEPTLHSNLPGILEILREFGYRGYIVTNGQSEEGIKKIMGFSDVIPYIRISLEGPDEKINDLVRGKGSFRKALRTIDFCKQKGLNVGTLTTLNAYNAGYVSEIFALAKRHKIDFVRFSTVHPCENSKKNNLNASVEVLREAHRVYRLTKVKYPQIESSFTDRHMLEYTDGDWPIGLCRPIDHFRSGELVLLPDGKVSFCCNIFDFGFSESNGGKSENKHHLNHILGDMQTDTFETILKNRKSLTRELLSRRRKDAIEGNFKLGRQFICQNCKSYFFD